MGKFVLLWAILSSQLLGCLSEDCPAFKKDVSWNYGGKGTIKGSSDPKSARACQESCQQFSRWEDSYRNWDEDYPCAGWSFWAEPGPWSDSSWCYLFENRTTDRYSGDKLEPLEKTASSALGALSGLKNDCETGKGPTVAEYLLEGVASLNLNKTNWKYIMAEDTDIDQDGDVSDIELEHKFGSYMEELFKMMDQDKNNIVTEEELESLRLDLPGSKKILDAVFESYPVKSTLLLVDGNRDGVLDDNDFYLPAKPFQGPLGQASGSLRLVGGKDGSSGDIFLGNKGLGCAPYPWDREDLQRKQSEVICRELGFSGFVKTTRRSTFTKSVRPRPAFQSKQFRCKGDEKKLMDCSMENVRDDYGNCYENNVQGIICNKKDGGIKMVENKFLEEITDWRSWWTIWEEMGRFIFIADKNNDGKLSSEEIIAKAKQYLETMFNFMDQTRDGFVSIKDFTSPHMTVGPIHQVIDRFFDKTGNDGAIDLMRPIIMGIDVMDFTGSNGDSFDRNNDTKLNADDSYLLGKYLGLGKEVHLISVLSKKLDKNQDGKLQRQEVRDFVDYIFKKLDIDKDGALTFEDAFGHMKENGVSCLSILEWRSFLPRFTEDLETQFGAMMKYFFKELDEDKNGKIGLKELQQLHVPCALSRKEVDIDPSRIRCYEVERHFFRALQKTRFPRLPFTGGNRGGPGSSENEMAEIACKMLS